MSKIGEATKEAMARRRFLRGAGAVGAAAAMGATPAQAQTKSAEQIEIGVAETLDNLFRLRPEFRTIYDRAYGVLVFPDIGEIGFIVSGSYGEGALVVNGLIDSYWSYGSAAVGFQAGAQRMELALFFMTQRALAEFKASDGFELGAEAEATVIDAGAEVAVDTTIERNAIIPVVISREGLMGGVSIQGGAYERIRR